MFTLICNIWRMRSLLTKSPPREITSHGITVIDRKTTLDTDRVITIYSNIYILC